MSIPVNQRTQWPRPLNLRPSTLRAWSKWAAQATNIEIRRMNKDAARCWWAFAQHFLTSASLSYFAGHISDIAVLPIEKVFVSNGSAQACTSAEESHGSIRGRHLTQTGSRVVISLSSSQDFAQGIDRSTFGLPQVKNFSTECLVYPQATNFCAETPRNNDACCHALRKRCDDCVTEHDLKLSSRTARGVSPGKRQP